MGENRPIKIINGLAFYCPTKTYVQNYRFAEGKIKYKAKTKPKDYIKQCFLSAICLHNYSSGDSQIAPTNPLDFKIPFARLFQKVHVRYENNSRQIKKPKTTKCRLLSV